MQFIDSHAHLNAAEFKESWKNIVIEAKNAGLSSIVNIGGDLDDSEWGSNQAQEEPIVYATVGLHPESLSGLEFDPTRSVNNLRRLISRYPKIVAIGEIGLDYTLDPTHAPKPAQIELIKPQIALALDQDLPIVLHVRDLKGSTRCFDDLIHILNQFKTSNTISTLRGVFHCWTGTPEQAQQALDLGFYISFSGIVTYKSAGHILEAAQVIPDNRLLIETDAPYLTPEPVRSRQHPSANQPKYVILTAEKLAQVRNTTLEHIASTTTSNAQQLFKLNQ